MSRENDVMVSLGSIREGIEPFYYFVRQTLKRRFSA